MRPRRADGEETPMPRRRSRHLTGLTAAVLTVTLAGCSGGSAPETRSAAAPEPRESTSRAAEPSPSRPAARTATESPSPSASTSTRSASASSAPHGGGVTRKTLAGRLLPAAQLPGFNDAFTWQESSTRRTEGGPFGTCHRVQMTSIGAMRVAVREYAAVDGRATDTAGELVAQFPDVMTARRAFEVLGSWRGQCEEQLAGYDRRRVGDLQRVVGADGDAGWYLLTYGPPKGGSEDEGYFDSQGLVRVGSRVAVLRMRMVGQDFNYAAGREPMVEAVRRAAGELG